MSHDFKHRKLRYVMVSFFMLVSMVVGSAVVLPSKVAAAVDPACDSNMFLGLPAWYKYLDVGTKEIKNKDGKLIGTDKCAIKGPLEDSQDANSKFDWQAALPLIILAGIEILLRLSALIAIGFVVVGGVEFITGQGEPEKAAKARNTIINALIGLVIAVSATALVSFIGRTIGG